MLARQRREIIVEAVRRDGSVRVRDLTTALGVSEMTVRRDLDALASLGLLDKVHGGATRVAQPSAVEPGFDAKLQRQQDEKDAIARTAAAMVMPGSSIGLTAGTTTWKLAQHLMFVANLTIVTNAPSIARIFHRNGRADLTVLLTGGMRTPSDALVGPLAIASLNTLHLDAVFMGVHGMDPQQGYSTPNLAEAETNQAFARATRDLVVVADHTKWATQGLMRIAPLGDASTVITDERLPDEGKRVFGELDVDLRLVSGAAATSASG